MITNNGKEIIAKYLLGQVPAYATHIALGCGSRPNSGTDIISIDSASITDNVATIVTDTNHLFRTGDDILIDGINSTFNGIYTVTSIPTQTSFTFDKVSTDTSVSPAAATAVLNFSEKEVMDFEMVRVPISSKGFINENGISKVALSAEMPTENRLEITEVALWSAGSNAIAQSDSRVLFSFSDTENWQLHTPTATTSIPTDYEPLDGGDDSGDINVTQEVFATNSDNASLLNSIRKDRQEGARFLNYTIIMRGDTSDIDSSFQIESGSTHIHLDGRNINLVQNSPNDEIKIGLSILSKEASVDNPPDITRIVIEFLQSENNEALGFARLTAEISAVDLVDNRYIVITKKLSELETAPEFSWSDIKLTRIYVSTFADEEDTSPSDQYYVALDAVRFDNISTPNPLYIMSGYGVVETPQARPIYKIANTSNYIEFRFAIGVS